MIAGDQYAHAIVDSRIHISPKVREKFQRELTETLRRDCGIEEGVAITFEVLSCSTEPLLGDCEVKGAHQHWLAIASHGR